MIYGTGVDTKDKDVLAYLTQWHDNQTIGMDFGLKDTDGFFNPAYVFRYWL